MVYDVHTLHFYTTVNTRDKHVWTNSLMLLDVPSYALLFAFSKCFALCGCKLAQVIVVLNFLVGQNLLTTEVLIITDKLHILQLLFHLLLNIDKTRLVA